MQFDIKRKVKLWASGQTPPHGLAICHNYFKIQRIHRKDCFVFVQVRLAVTTKRKSCDLVIDKVWRNLCSVGQLRHPELNTTVSFLKANAES